DYYCQSFDSTLSGVLF
nr:immunoglobulin light chain junction region [Macaca mulatta]MOX29436.1 immunoglobulin light chain junction region [Macaca mulatta]MOX29773.1 immunoglobulin light chain junction region [Macaca mulatta]MOX29807.1 immunoglobulin light chain junction region [Macaca mulatta]MOX30012.1 immunoglobulin light chain junction region [Macaca mulatta]